MSARVLLLFVDGVGVGPADPAVNPFLHARLPVLSALLDDELPAGDVVRRSTARATFVPLDATLGVPGLPQSGTGQAALLTGMNAAAARGRHLGPWVPTALREQVRTESVLARARALGRSAAFANAYPEEVLSDARGATRIPPFLRAGPPLAALGAGLLVRHTEALRKGDAVASEIVNDGWRERLGRTELPVITAPQAGANLARIAAAHDLTLFAHYSTDSAGHEQSMPAAIAALERVDTFLGGLLADAPPGLLTVLVSDHGNVEDTSRGHTMNPALCLLVGPRHEAHAEQLYALTDVAPMLLRVLDEEEAD